MGPTPPPSCSGDKSTRFCVSIFQNFSLAAIISKLICSFPFRVGDNPVQVIVTESPAKSLAEGMPQAWSAMPNPFNAPIDTFSSMSIRSSAGAVNLLSTSSGSLNLIT